MWRKTRKPNSGSSCVGVDPNRNWDAGFGGEMLLSLQLYSELGRLLSNCNTLLITHNMIKTLVSNVI